MRAFCIHQTSPSLDNSLLALICMIRGDNFKKHGLIDYNFQCFISAVTELFKFSQKNSTQNHVQMICHVITTSSQNKLVVLVNPDIMLQDLFPFIDIFSILRFYSNKHVVMHTSPLRLAMPNIRQISLVLCFILDKLKISVGNQKISLQYGVAKISFVAQCSLRKKCDKRKILNSVRSACQPITIIETRKQN